jgi:NhaP-type Na+/H+ and K+/H+ antiporter
MEINPMTTFLLALFGFLMARLLWNTIQHFAKKCGELPIVWFFKTVLIFGALAGLIGGMGLFFLYALSRMIR